MKGIILAGGRGMQLYPVTRSISFYDNANISKAKRFLGFEPTHTIEQGMGLALDWYIQTVK